MKESSNRNEIERHRESAWLLNPERTREDIFLYSVIIALVVCISLLVL